MRDILREGIRAALMESLGLGRRARALLLRIDAGPYHSMPLDELEDGELDDVDALIAARLVRHMPADERLPERVVLTGSGSRALGTFDMDTLRDERHADQAPAPKVNPLGVRPMVKI